MILKKFTTTLLGKLIVKLLATEIGKLIIEEILKQFKTYLNERLERSNTGLTEQARFYAQNIISIIEPKDFLNNNTNVLDKYQKVDEV